MEGGRDEGMKGQQGGGTASQTSRDRRPHLSDAVVLQVDDSGHGHLHAAKHSHHFQDLIIKGRSGEGLRRTDR